MSINKKFLKRLTILYAEDSKIQRLKTLQVLEPLFKEVIVAVDGKDGLEKYMKNKNNIDVIISDIIMPEITGLEMIKKIRTVDSKIPCIFTTSIITSDALVEAIDLNISHYAVKPFDYTKLIKELQNACITIFQQKLLEQKEIESKQFLDAINEVAIISRTDLKGKITYVNRIFCDISQYDLNELIGQPHNIVRHPDVSPTAYKELWETIQNGKRWSGTIKNKAKDGSSYYVKSYVYPIINEDFEVKEYIGIRFLMTSEEEAKQDLKIGMIQNLNAQKLTASAMKKENIELKKKIKELSLDNTTNADLQYVHKRIDEERTKHNSTKRQLDVTEGRLSQLQLKYDTLLARVT